MGTSLTQTHTEACTGARIHVYTAKHTGAYNLCLRRNGINIYRPWKCQLLPNKEPIYLWIWHSWRLAAIFCFSKCVFGGWNGRGSGRSQDGDKGLARLTGSSERWAGADSLLLQPSPEEKKRKGFKVLQDGMSAIKEWRRAMKISQMWANHSSALTDWLTLFSVYCL